MQLKGLEVKIYKRIMVRGVFEVILNVPLRKASKKLYEEEYTRTI